MEMKITHGRFRLVAILFAVAVPFGFAAPFDAELNYHILSAERPSEPEIFRNMVVFSYSSPKTQMVSLAFEHEQYSKLYTYKRNPHNVFMLTLPLPEGISRLHYRIIADGLWTTDPNAELAADARGIPVSRLSMPVYSKKPVPGVTQLPDGSTQFVYTGAPGSQVSLIGDFNGWDPFILPMPESLLHSGVYSVNVNLMPNSRFYRFVVDGKDITDPVNSMKAVNGWGEQASVLP
ncbi:MAG: hypothetical protein B0D92_02220 [Spirochaeta sp. LUC14_002_19_P3]|nr:MAG: hypothetical protein B0D92_02220 [Spirochaeta sp. LUC14_002_19_P3]